MNEQSFVGHYIIYRYEYASKKTGYRADKLRTDLPRDTPSYRVASEATKNLSV